MALYLDELNAINQGVAVDKLSVYMQTYEKWWKLNNKSTLSANEFKTLQSLNNRKTAIEEEYQKQMRALQQELQDALMVDGTIAADLGQNLARRSAEYQESYTRQIQKINDSYLDTSGYRTFYSNLQKQQQDAEKALNSGKPWAATNSKQRTLEMLEAQAQAYAEGATYENFSDYKTAIEFVTDAVKKYAAKTNAGFKDVWEQYLNDSSMAGLIGSTIYGSNAANQKKFDSYVAQIRNWNAEKSGDVEALQTELADKLKELQIEYEKQINENESNIASKKEELWNTAKEIANYQVSTLQVMIDNLETVINKYKAVAEMLENTSIETLKKYNVMNLLGLNSGANDISTLLSDQLKKAINSTEVKIADLIDQADLYQDLLNAADKNDFRKIFDNYYESASSSTRAMIDKMIAQLDSNLYDDYNSWVQEWNQGLSDAISGTIDAIQEIQQLKDEFRENIYMKGLTNAIEQAEALSSRLGSMADVIDDAWTSDENGLTIYGMAKIKTLGQQLEQAQKQVDQYAQKVRALQQAQNDPLAQFDTEEDYIKAYNEALGEYYQQLSNVESISQTIYQLAKKRDEEEINRMQKIIDLQKKSYNAKKQYYEYDKSIKASDKELQNLRAQLDALRDIETAEALAKKASLEEQLKDAQDKRQELEMNHLFELETDGLDEWLAKFNETLDDSTKTVDESFRQFAETLTNILNDASMFDSTEAYENILDLLMGNGYTLLDSDATQVATTGSYTQTSNANVETSGGKYVQLSQSEFLSTLSSSLNAQTVEIVPYLNSLTNNLESISDVIKKQLVESVKNLANKDTSVNVNLNYDNLLQVNGNIDKDFLPDLKSLLRQSADYTKSEIYDELKKMGITRSY